MYDVSFGPADIASSKRRTASEEGLAGCCVCPRRKASGNVSGARPEASDRERVTSSQDACEADVPRPRSNVIALTIISPVSSR